MLQAPLTNPTLIKQIFNQYGVVAITDVLSIDECQETIDDVEKIIKKETGDNTFSFNDPNTYDSADRCMNRYGTIGKYPLFSQTLLRNRTHPNVAKAFEIVYNNDNLVTQHDRIGWMRPTIATDGTLMEKYATPFDGVGLHLDVNPKGYFDPKYKSEVDKFLSNIPYKEPSDMLAEYGAKNITMGLQLQSVLNLIDNDEEDGGFQCVLGGHHKIHQWYDKAKEYMKEQLPNGNYIFNIARAPDRELIEDSVRVPCPAGTLIIFDLTLPHGTKPNHSQKNRMVQFIRYMPRTTLPKACYKKRNTLVNKMCQKVNFEPDDRQKKILLC